MRKMKMRNRKWRSNVDVDEEVLLEAAQGDNFFKEPAFLERVENRIYFYSEIERDRVLELNKNIRSLGNDIIHESLVKSHTPENIYLHIQSYGGTIFSGLAAVDEILNSRVPVHTIIDGCAASAATLLSVVGKRRYINRNAFMLIHQLTSGCWGKFVEFEDEMKNLNLLMKTLKNIYTKHTKIPMKELNKIMEHDLWFDAETCLKYGIVDEIIEPGKTFNVKL